jgi:hypothetical protein
MTKWNAEFTTTRNEKVAEFRRKRTATLVELRRSFIMKGYGTSQSASQAATAVAIAEVLSERDALV